ncbi:MAG TPA: AIM24 family protein [Streptosporangiaceae bacterium]|nr:AIM24 family protein [Streptosporangiaceae bacterium]
MSMPPPQGAYTCPYCRMASDGGGGTCPHCGAPTDIRLRVSDSGWVEQPAIRDMARIRFSRSTCQISGTYVPVAEMGLHNDDWVYFSHHALLHADPQVRLANLPMKGGWKRLRAGLPMMMMTAQGPGRIAFSADVPGDTLAVPLHAGQAVDVVEHRFLLATGNVTYQWDRSHVWFTTGTGDDKEWHYPLGQTIDRFVAQGSNGLLMLHGPGNTFIRDLAPRQRILVQPGGLIWKDPSVRMFLHFEYPRGAYWFSSARWQAKSIWLTLEGPGRIAVQSVFERPEMAGSVTGSSSATTQYW